MFCRLRQCRQILPKLNLSAILLLFLIKRAALGNLKVNFHCAHWHRFFPLKKASPLFSFFNSLYAPSSVPLFPGDRNLREEEETAPPVALIRCAIWLTGHLRFRQSVCAGWYRIGNYAPAYSIRCSVSAYIISFSQLIY